MLSNNFDFDTNDNKDDDFNLLDSNNKSPKPALPPSLASPQYSSNKNNNNNNNINKSNINQDNDEDSNDFAKRLSNVNQHLSQQASANSNHVLPSNVQQGNGNSPFPTTTTTTTNNNNSNNSSSYNKYTPTFNDEDYAAELQSEYNRENSHQQQNESLFDPSYDSTFDLPEIVTHSEDHHRYISLKRTATIIKAISMFIMFFSIMTYFVQAWWLIFSLGLVMNPLGFYSAHYFKGRMFLMFNAYLVVDIIFRLSYLFANIKTLNGFGIFLSFVIVFMEGYFTYFCWNFYKRLPKTMTPTLREFFRQDAGLFSV
ncbi:hypothetical protein PPL_03369 [Heterostelium album PN500]|uniref:Uncharacterized protein n=1 Tax=Heterostelium pallidum (strain ATCC 26659 / Pp 5 / PN500) TaxID=670386 RepID=D3B4P4_HETP5|nr:hypothetical protein PPL_03369 [Heterostelium album PN500]EFA84292.1 hypothetical protein PPL_03369 [Heterostelium album PN500]|eukprot:XP_020436408.1 hypothetical protein PPL_03369 [Heterostelium album PN500]